MEARTSRCCTLLTGNVRKAAQRRSFEGIADFYGVRQRLVVQLDHFRAIGGSALTDRSIAVPENELAPQPAPQNVGETSEHTSSIPVTYVPFRNAHFLSVAVSWAEAIGAGAIYIGAVAEDSSGYPDCRLEYYRVFQELIRVGTRPETEIRNRDAGDRAEEERDYSQGAGAGCAAAADVVLLSG